MTSLLARIAALLIAAIVAVVVLVTYAATRAMGPPADAATVAPLAAQIAAQVAFVRADPAAAAAAGLRPVTTAPAGRPDDRLSARLAQELPGLGVTALEGAPDAPSQVLLTLGDGQMLVIAIPHLGAPPGARRLLLIWITGIVIGSGAVSLYAAWRVTRPLHLLNAAVERVGRDGTFVPVPVKGSGEIRATALAINRLSDRLKHAMQSGMRLVAAAGHDLRTPMTRMRLRAEFVADPEEREKWLADLEELNLIADSAIRLVREEVSQDRVETFDADDLLREVADELSALGYAVRLAGLAPLRITAAPFALKRAIRNLAINGATHGGGAVMRLYPHAGMAVIEIVDAGPGIPPDLADRVFEPFFRVDPARRKTVPGAGLGLAIARDIIERAGGQVTIRANRPQGLVVTVTLAAA